MEKLGKGSVLICFAGSFQLPEAGTFVYHPSKHHFGMLYKVAVHRDAVLVRVKVNPVWLDIYHSVTLLQNQNIARDLRACVGSESVVGKPDRP